MPRSQLQSDIPKTETHFLFRSPRREQNSKRIPTLDGWRAFAILLVVAHHAGTAFYTESQYYNISPTRFGTWGVPVFFGLSGLLITKLLLEENDRTGDISLKSFYVRRAFRILPLVFLYIFTIAAFGFLVSRTELVSSIFFFRNYLPESLGGVYTAHLWSLAIEEQFYLIWPGLLVLVGVRRGLRTAAGLSVALAVWVSVDFHFHLFQRVLPALNSDARTDLRLNGLFCGCAVAFLLHNAQTREWLRKHFSFVVWIVLALGIVADLRYQPYLTAFWIAVLIPSLMAGTALHPEWALSRLLDLEPVKWVGRISYSLYVWQQLFLIPSWDSKPLGVVQHWPYNIVLALLCACLSYYLVEKPLIHLGHRLAANYSTAPKALAAAARS